MPGFIQRHAANVMGVLSGFDRVRLRGTLRWLSNVRDMYGFLQASSVLLKDFTRYAKGITEQIRQRAAVDAVEAGRPVIYLNSSQESKEEIARAIAERDGVREGLICVLTCVEPCYYHSVGRLRLLRAHGLVAKIPKTHRHQLTALGRTAIPALMNAQHANAAQLNELAA